MKKLSSRSGLLAFPTGAACLSMALAAPPAWWSDPQTGFIDASKAPNNAGPVVAGQLKNVAKKAALYLDQRLPGGSGSEIQSLVWSFSPNDFDLTPVSLAQLKAVTKPFYDRLILEGFDTRASLQSHGAPGWPYVYPWNPATPKDQNLSPAVLGQLKWCFAFELTGNINGDAFPDWWTQHWWGDTAAHPSNADDDHDGLTNLDEFQMGANPASPDSDLDGTADQSDGDPLIPDVGGYQIAHFPFDDSSFHNDSWQLPRTPAAGQSLPASVSGFIGKGAQFTVPNQMLVYDWKDAITHHINYAFKRGTVSLWVKPLGWGTPGMSGLWGRLFELGSWTPDESVAFTAVHFHASAPCLLFTEVNGAGRGSRYGQSSAISMPPNTWHQVAVTYDETGQSLYVDGQLRMETTTPFTANPVLGDILNLGLMFGSDGGSYLNGILDEVRIFNYRMAADQAHTEYRQALSDPTDADHNNLPDVWENRYFGSPGQNPASNPDNDGLSNILEYQLGYDPTDHDSDDDGLIDSNEDYDEDGLTNVTELASTGTNAAYFDTDGDLLGDGFEVANGLDPKASNGSQGATGDGDGDGLDNFDEQMYGTSASTADANADGKPDGRDTDGDGTSDGDEASRGSDPNNSSDGGQAPPPETIEEVDFSVGDPSGSHSERWQLTLKGMTSAIDGKTIKFQSRKFGEMESKSFKLHKGAKYELTLKHIATDPNYDHTDYDWQAQVGGLPGTLVLDPQDEGKALVTKSWVVDNRQGALGVCDESFDEEDKSTGKKAFLLPVVMVTPTGDPVNSPVDGGDGSGTVPDGANEFTYSPANPGILTLKLKARVEGIASLGNSVLSHLKFETDAINGSSFIWQPGSEGGKASTEGSDFIKAEAKYTGLPQNNSDFGKKKARVMADGDKADEKGYEVFFPKNEKNHPGAGVGTTPNWFFYWSQAGAFSNLAYGGTYAGRYGYFDYSGSDGHLDHAIIYDAVVVFDNPTGPKGKAGMDCFGQTASHELKHREQFHQSGYPDSNGDGVPEKSDAMDGDGDWLSDSYEDNHGFDKTKQDTDGDGIKDLEEEPIAVESNWSNDSHKNKDWASPGKNKNL